MAEQVDKEIRILQAFGSGLMSRKTAVTELGWVDDVDEELRLIEEDRRNG